MIELSDMNQDSYKRSLTAIALGALAVTACSQEATRDENNELATAGEVSAFAVSVGDCFQDAPSGEVSDLPGVPCSEPHYAEAFAVFDVSVTEWPGGEEMSDLGGAECIERFEEYVGRDFESSDLNLTALTPTEDSWDRAGDREVICLTFRVDEADLEGSVKGSGI